MIKITNKNGESKEYKLKVTLGFYKKLSFPKSELSTINDNAGRLFEAIKLALYFGNKSDKNWSCIADMEKEISDEAIEDIDDGNIIEKLSEAIVENYPDALKKALEEKFKEENEEDSKKK